ncbi:MAG TPA: PepSY domain-containing protein [Pirellulales bacterium]|nr:PepSY domain-containing protein [Pirellulales bacterium]
MQYKRLFLAAVIGAICSFSAVLAADATRQTYAHAKAGLAKAKLSLAEAVDAALKKVPRGKAVEANLEHGTKATVFLIEVVSREKHLDVEIDSATGEVLGVEEEQEGTEEAKKGTDEPDDEELENEAAERSKTSLAEAIRTAGKELQKGKPFAAAFERKEGKLVVKVELLNGDDVSVIDVDAETGKLLKVKNGGK